VTPQDRAWRDALIAYAIVAALVTALVRIDVKLPAIGHLGSALVSVLFLYAPIVILARRKQDIADYGFVLAPLGRGLATAGAAIAVVFPLFALGYFAFYELVCRSELLAQLAPNNLCASYGGLRSLHPPPWSWDLGTEAPRVLSLGFVLVQLLVVALPEELFFRGYLLGLLEQRFPPRYRLGGGGIGLALVLSSLAFALIHLPKDGDPRVLATFFPGLLFGWMRSATGSILAPTLAHGASNILVRVLDLAVMR
jgi:uncharacterized protein